MSIKLAMKPKCKADIYNKEKTMKHGASFPKLSWNRRIAWTKARERNL